MKTIAAEDFDRIFDDGEEDITEYLDLSTGRRINRPNETKRVNIDFPLWMVDALDEEADALAISRQAVVKTWIAERIRATA